MKREVPVAQFFPLEAPSAYKAYRKALTLNPSPALRLTTQPETLNCVMKYIFNWPVKGAELLYTCLLNLWQTLITYCSLAYSFPICTATDYKAISKTQDGIWFCAGRKPSQLFKQRWVGPIWTLLWLCVFTLKSNVIWIKSINYVARTVWRPGPSLTCYISPVKIKGHEVSKK